MDFEPGQQLDSSRMETGGGGGGGGLAIGGGIGGLVLLVLSLFLGPDVVNMFSGSSAPDQPATNQYAQECHTTDDIKTKPMCRFNAYENSTTKYWSQTLSGFRPINKFKTFTGSTNTACGAADASVGPFYCPADQKIYLDASFFDVMTKQLGAKGGPAAELYVFAHEYGHHISNLTGTMAVAQKDRSTGPDSAQVRLELQADCYAGAYLKWAATNSTDMIGGFTQDDLNRAVDAAISVGDDRIQKRSTGRVDRESWTHGSSAMRKAWMAKGWTSGDPRQCNTFAQGVDLTGGR